LVIRHWALGVGRWAFSGFHTLHLPTCFTQKRFEPVWVKRRHSRDSVQASALSLAKAVPGLVMMVPAALENSEPASAVLFR
jgi:hypothetical protein